ncbi:MAG: aminoglycoside phosphotransferase family protein [Actinomycetota bacterium]|nr:aminoglycoside phosphotransferase family protein [Actinomycetota bacterium]
MVIPVALACAAQREQRHEWLSTLPETIGRLQMAWSIQVGEPFQPGGQTAWVAPATRHREDLVLKVLWRHPEAEHEADGLRIWDGDGAVRLHAATEVDVQTTALLLERCRPGSTLEARPELQQDLVVAGLLRRLWRQPPPAHRFRSLQSMCERWADDFEHKTAGNPGVDPGLVRDGIALLRQLPASAERDVVLCTDLHAGNVLAAEREPWLVIDPKPHVGDPTYDALQHLLNCDTRLHTDPHGLLRRMAELLELDPDRLQLWLFARCVQESPDWPSLAEVARRVAPP